MIMMIVLIRHLGESKDWCKVGGSGEGVLGGGIGLFGCSYSVCFFSWPCQISLIGNLWQPPAYGTSRIA